MRSLRAWAVMAAGMTVLVARDLMACPGYAAHDDGRPGAGLLVVLGILVGVPAVMFQLVAPPPVMGAAAAKVMRLRLWGALLGALLLGGMAWKERRAWLHKVRETLRHNVMFEGAAPFWRQWARSSPGNFHRVYGLSALWAAGAVVLMWVDTIVDPSVTWGEGLTFVASFTTDTVITGVVAYLLVQRVAFHLAAGLVEGGVVARTLRTVARSLLLGGAAGMFGGALFGLNCGTQTLFMVEAARPDWVPFLVGYYAMHGFLAGALACLGLGFALMWPGRREAPLLRA